MTTSRTTLAMTRRRFGLLAGSTALASLAAPGRFGIALADDVDSASVIAGKASGMIIHNAQLGVMETPIAMLRGHAVTPKDVLFSRLHFPHEGANAWYATTEAPDRPDWTITIGGLVARSRQVTLAELQSMDQVSRTMVLQCAGNGRGYYAAREHVAGGQWQNGGMGNVVWEGVPLREFLAAQDALPSADAHWLTAEGWDQPATREGSDFAKSYPLTAKALDHAILALKMNGEPIPAVHGGPVRLVVPGYYGNMNVKFLTALNYESEQSPSTFQSVAYRMPNYPVAPGEFEANDYTIYNSTPTYGMKIKSVIFAPLPEDAPSAGPVEISGVAFNDGEAPITSVEVSVDGGANWMAADVTTPDDPWAWYPWTARATLVAGTNVLMVRATDGLGRTQPMDGLTRWNPRGYEWNGVQRLEITV